MQGTIDRVNFDRGFGFISAPQMPDVFFHWTNLDGIEFREEIVGQRVEVEYEKGPKGPRALMVRPAK